MVFVSDLNDFDGTAVDQAGGKGASLSELMRLGVPVPPGFVILAPAFGAFLQANGIGSAIGSMLQELDGRDVRELEFVANKARSLVLDADIPNDIVREVEDSFDALGAERVAVRSSATEEDGLSSAWAGQLDTFLNTTRDALLENVKQCWASLYGARALSYRLQKNCTVPIGVAVVVQKMVRSDLSGTAFSIHPVTQNGSHLVIEAGYGLGEALVAGGIIPDYYVVDKAERVILDVNVSRQERMLAARPDGGVCWIDIPDERQAKQKLPGRQILELADLVIAIENHRRCACDIEWAVQESRIYITQSRPITTLSRAAVSRSETANPQR